MLRMFEVTKYIGVALSKGGQKLFRERRLCFDYAFR